MDEKLIEKNFLKLKKLFIKRLGRKGLYDSEVNQVCKKLFKSQWLGCHPQDKTVFKPGYQIINTSLSTSGDGGVHWVAIFMDGETIHIYDSFARPASKLLKFLTRTSKHKKIKIKNSDTSDQEQFGDKSQICGQLSISWLLCVQQYGIKSAMLI